MDCAAAGKKASLLLTPRDVLLPTALQLEAVLSSGPPPADMAERLGALLRRLPHFRPQDDQTLAFGKHKGKTFAEVWDCDPDYVLWCADHLGPKAGTKGKGSLTANQEKFIAYLRARGETELAELEKPDDPQDDPQD